MSGQKIIGGLKDAVAGNFSRVTIEGQTWTRTHPQASEWRAIESAPKDGTTILACYDSTVDTCRWVREEYAKKPNPYWCWNHSFGKTWNRSRQPTHWQPLPAPPTPSHPPEE